MLVNQSVLDVELAEDLAGIGLVYGTSQSVGFASSTGFLAILELSTGVMDPATDQAAFADQQLLANPSVYVENPARSIVAVREWFEDLFVLDAEGVSPIGGIEVPWFEFSVTTDNSFPCPEDYGSNAERCTAMLSSWFHSDVESTNRHFAFAEIGVLVVVGANDGGPIDSVLADFQPLLDGMTFSSTDD